MKKILITGKDSYIGTSFESWMSQYDEAYQIETLDMKDESWRTHDFSSYDVVFHVAGIAHIKETAKNRDLYYKVNRDLPIEVAQKAKTEGVSQFIFMSTMAVYGEEGTLGKRLVIKTDTPVHPKTFYGISKVEAENALEKLNAPSFKVAILRPPMVYGDNCPGNYARLEKIALKSPIFPLIENERSMLHIDTLCDYLKEWIDDDVEGIYFPQDADYVNTSLMVKNIALKHQKSLHLSKNLGKFIVLLGKKVGLVNKVFGSLVYEE